MGQACTDSPGLVSIEMTDMAAEAKEQLVGIQVR